MAALAHQLAAEGGRLAIAVDSVEGVRRLADAMDDRRRGGAGAVIDVFVEIDVGQGRCGVRPGRLRWTLAHEIRKRPALRFAGLQAYHGKAQHVRTPQARRDAIAAVVQDVQFTRKLMEQEGLQVPLVTGAGTGSMVCEAASGVFGELQAGSVRVHGCRLRRQRTRSGAARIRACAVREGAGHELGDPHGVCDAGHKSHAIDSGLPKVLVLPATGALDYLNGGDEHGILKPAGGNQRVPRLDDTVWLIPGHCDPTVNLHNHLIGVVARVGQGPR